MSWQATTQYQPFVSPRSRLLLAGTVVFIAIVRCVAQYLEDGHFDASFYLYAGFALVVSVLEWKHYDKPKQVSLVFDNGRLIYTNQYTGEMHTVYQSRVHWIKEEADSFVFYGESSIAIRIPIKYFNEVQKGELKQIILSWNKKLVAYGAS